MSEPFLHSEPLRLYVSDQQSARIGKGSVHDTDKKDKARMVRASRAIANVHSPLCQLLLTHRETDVSQS